jgi:transcriptional regulator with GAF, ATPase, and Fis domain
MQNEYLISITAEAPPLRLDSNREADELHTKIANIRDLIGSLEMELGNLQMINLPEINDEFDFYREVARYERKLIQNALRLAGGSQVKAARLLKLKPTTLNSKMKHLRLLPR